jgi:hypothetical protein
VYRGLNTPGPAGVTRAQWRDLAGFATLWQSPRPEFNTLSRKDFSEKEGLRKRLRVYAPMLSSYFCSSLKTAAGGCLVSN